MTELSFALSRFCQFCFSILERQNQLFLQVPCTDAYIENSTNCIDRVYPHSTTHMLYYIREIRVISKRTKLIYVRNGVLSKECVCRCHMIGLFFSVTEYLELKMLVNIGWDACYSINCWLKWWGCGGSLLNLPMNPRLMQTSLMCNYSSVREGPNLRRTSLWWCRCRWGSRLVFKGIVSSECIWWLLH